MSLDDSGSNDAGSNNSEDSTESYRDWPHQLPLIQELGEEILEEWERQNPNSPRDYPTIEWLVNNGYSHLRWVLETKHSMGVMEFFVALTSAGGSEGYDWDIDDVATIERAQAYLEDQAECRGWSDATRQTQRYRLNSMLRRYGDEIGTDEIIARANDTSCSTELYEAAKSVIKDVRAEQGIGPSGYQHMRSLHRFFEWLLRLDRIEYDPMEDIEEEFPWELEESAESLSDEQVRQLWEAAETIEEYVLIIGYCIWGLRTAELPAVHVDQFNFNGADPSLDFDDEDDRKNGVGSVTLLFGLNKLAYHISRLERIPDWNGCLFPSDESGLTHLSAQTMRNRFKDLSEKSGVTINGQLATPRHGRAYFYNVQFEAQERLVEYAAEIAEEQGSMDPHSVIDHYLTERQKRRVRRLFFRTHIRQVLPDEAYIDNLDTQDSNSELDDF